MTAAIPKTPPQDHPYVEVFSEIGTIEHFLRLAVTRHLPEGVTYAHFELLNHFARHGDGQTPVELSRAMMMTKGAITNILQKLETLGYVAVLADCADRRKKRVRVTRTGLNALSAIRRDMKRNTEALREGFTDNEFRAAIPFLRALRTFLSELTGDQAE